MSTCAAPVTWSSVERVCAGRDDQQRPLVPGTELVGDDRVGAVCVESSGSDRAVGQTEPKRQGGDRDDQQGDDGHQER